MTNVLTGVEVGTLLPSIRIPAISRTTLALFAGASGDHNAIHLDVDIARSAGLDDVFAQGMLSMAYLGRLLTDWAPQQSLRSFEVRFGAITPIHAEPYLAGRVSAIEVEGLERRATVDVSVTLADGTVTLTGTAVIAVD
jgi:acyl dehydratase